jgi:transcriptional regulator with XRE-family HTH domain
MLSGVPRSFPRVVRLAAQLLGAQIRQGRIDRGWTVDALAERAQVSPTTVKKVERGDPTVGLGITFDVATLVGVPLFTDDQTRLAEEVIRARERLMLLPRRIRMPEPGPIDDDF